MHETQKIQIMNSTKYNENIENKNSKQYEDLQKYKCTQLILNEEFTTP